MVMTFKENPDSWMVGRRANGEEWNGFSRTFETGSGAELRFGEPVARGTGDRGCIAYTNANFIGIAETNQVLHHVGDYYTQYDTVAVMEWGVIAVNCGANTVAAGDPAAWDSGDRLWFADGDTANPAIDGAVFETSGTGIQLLRLRK